MMVLPPKETVMSSCCFALRRPSVVQLAALLCCGLLNSAQADQGDRQQPSASPSAPAFASGPAYRKGVVSVANPYGAEAGARMLEMGGNAVDAAVAIAYALNVVEPQSAGIGGGGFMMIHLAGRGGHERWRDEDDDDGERNRHRGPRGRTFAIDTREKAPAGATPGMFVGVPNSSLQGVAVGVPGMVRGSELALRRFGRLDLADVLQPAITLADDGFAATARYALVSCNPRSQNSPESTAVFCPNGNGTLGPVAGTLVQNKPLAETLRLVARHGADCFYRYQPEKGCDIAKGIIEGQTFAKPGLIDGVLTPGKGGSMTYEDLAAYRPALRALTQGTYRGYTIKAMSPPSSGGLTLLQMLKMLERFPIGDASQGYGFGSAKTANVMAEAMRTAFADRSIWMGDADFVPVPQRGLLDDTYVGLRGAAIVPGTRIDPNPLPGDPRPYEIAGLQTDDAFLGGGQVGQHGLVHQHHRVLARHRRLRRLHAGRRHEEEPRLPAQQRADRLQHRANDQPLHRQRRLQRRAAHQAPAQQHDAGDDLFARRPTAHRLRLARRRNDHQLGAQRHVESARPQDVVARRDQRAAAVGDQRHQQCHGGSGVSAGCGRCAARARLHRGYGRHRLGAGGAGGAAQWQAVRRRRRTP
jgi:gamma-glutamyltranspeptidase